MKEQRDPQTYAIIGAAIEVHKRLGVGFLEGVYHEALAIEFRCRDIPFKREIPLTVYYRDEPLTCQYRADFLCFDDVIVELKAVRTLSGTEESQVINYLKATGNRRGLLLNFGTSTLEYKRFVL